MTTKLKLSSKLYRPELAFVLCRRPMKPFIVVIRRGEYIIKKVLYKGMQC